MGQLNTLFVAFLEYEYYSGPFRALFDPLNRTGAFKLYKTLLDPSGRFTNLQDPLYHYGPFWIFQDPSRRFSFLQVTFSLSSYLK